ncbi:MAG: DinB family protein [Deferrisomatales bacterium]|nr:DinB family protein [Deferrisomatales bacterium]
MASPMQELLQAADRIEALAAGAVERWGATREALAENRPGPGEWSAKEVVGHLIDSASNNHQRFVRLQLVDGLDFPDYGADNEAWVRLQRYRERPWPELLALWRGFNGHLAHVMRSVDPDCLENLWVIDTDRSISLRAMMVDYVGHLELHVRQIEVAMMTAQGQLD